MKKHLLLFLFALSCACTLKAQQYYPMLDSVNRWTYSRYIIGVRLADTCSYPGGYYAQNPEFFTDGDSIINATSYKVVYNFGADWGTDTCLYGFIREDSSLQKVWFKDVHNNPERVLYDFTMQIGDSMEIQFYHPNGIYTSGFYTLDSILPIMTVAGERRAFYLDCRTCINNSGPLEWIEGVGNTMDAIYPYAVNEFGYYSPHNCNGYFVFSLGQALTCFNHVAQVYKDSCLLQEVLKYPAFYWYVDDCHYGNYPGAVKTFGVLNSIQLSPNPVHDKINVNLPGMKQTVYGILMNTMMQQIAPVHTLRADEIITIDVSSLPQGLYFMMLKAGNEMVVKKFVKE